MTKIKKIFLFMLALVLVIPTAVLFAACGDDSPKYSYVTVTGETEGFMPSYNDYGSVFNLPTYTASEGDTREAIEAGKTFDISFNLEIGYELPGNFEIVCNGVSYHANDFQRETNSSTYELKDVVAPNNDFTINIVHGPKKITSTVTFNWNNALSADTGILNSTHFKSNVSFGDVVANTEYTFAELKEIFSGSKVFEYGDQILFEVWNDDAFVSTEFIKEVCENYYSTMDLYDKETKHAVSMIDVYDYDIEIELYEESIFETSSTGLYDSLVDRFTVSMSNCDVTGYKTELIRPYGYEMYTNYYDPTSMSLKTNSDGGFFGQFVLIGYTYSDEFKAVYDNMSLKIGESCILTRGAQTSASTFTIEVLDVGTNGNEDLEGVLTINIPSFFDVIRPYGNEGRYINQYEINYVTISAVVVKENGTTLNLTDAFVDAGVLMKVKFNKWFTSTDTVLFAVVAKDIYEQYKQDDNFYGDPVDRSNAVVYEEDFGGSGGKIYYVPTNYEKVFVLRTTGRSISSITINGKTIVVGAPKTDDGFQLVYDTTRTPSYELTVPAGFTSVNDVVINFS